MATKREVVDAAARGEGCLGKAAEGEPVFVLRAQDKLAPMLVEFWAEMARANGCPKDKADDARVVADQMRKWPDRKCPD